MARKEGPSMNGGDIEANKAFHDEIDPNKLGLVSLSSTEINGVTVRKGAEIKFSYFGEPVTGTVNDIQRFSFYIAKPGEKQNYLYDIIISNPEFGDDGRIFSPPNMKNLEILKSPEE